MALPAGGTHGPRPPTLFNGYMDRRLLLDASKQGVSPRKTLGRGTVGIDGNQTHPAPGQKRVKIKKARVRLGRHPCKLALDEDGLDGPPREHAPEAFEHLEVIALGIDLEEVYGCHALRLGPRVSRGHRDIRRARPPLSGLLKERVVLVGVQANRG